MIAIIKGCGNNIASLQYALTRLGASFCFTDDAAIIQSASHVILPGVGTAKQAMHDLNKANLIEVIRNCDQPLLGICLGMQILYSFSEEGNVDTLGMLKGKITAFPTSNRLPLPHMGWNSLLFSNKKSVLLNEIENHENVYFVHGYQAPVNEYTRASCQYGVHFSAAVQHKNIFGVQFHPEKSGKTGERILKNFLEETT